MAPKHWFMKQQKPCGDPLDSISTECGKFKTLGSLQNVSQSTITNLSKEKYSTHASLVSV